MPAFREQLAKSKHIVVLTGAGVSAESGVPTFRGAGGYWRKWQAQVVLLLLLLKILLSILRILILLVSFFVYRCRFSSCLPINSKSTVGYSLFFL